MIFAPVSFYKKTLEKNILIFVVVNSRYDSKLKLKTALFKNAGNKIFKIFARDKHKGYAYVTFNFFPIGP